MSVLYVYRISKCVGGITQPKHAHAQSQFWEFKIDQWQSCYSFRLYTRAALAWMKKKFHFEMRNLKGNCSGKKIIFFIPSIDRVCGSDAQGKKSDFLHGSVRRYKTLRSSTNCGCGHLMTHFVGIAITQQFIVVAFTCPGGVHCWKWRLLQGQLLLHYKLPGPQGNKGYMKGQAMELWLGKGPRNWGAWLRCSSAIS